MGILSSAAAPRIAGAALLVAVVLGLARPELARVGYTPDEEFTEFAVRGISANGLPLLPSGLLYDRGLGYSYAAWLVRATDDHSLTSARALSLASALVAALVLWVAVRDVARELSAWLAALLLVTSVPFWVVATSARFYAPFLACYLAALALLSHVARRGRPGPTAAEVVGLVVVAAACRWTHELAFTLAAIPLACAALAPARDRAVWIKAALAIAAGLAVAQAGIFALHFAAPHSGDTMIRRFFLWQVLNLFERPPLAAPIGLLFVVTLAAVILAPTSALVRFLDARRRVLLALAAVVVTWGALTAFRGAFDYPLDLFTHLARTMPVLVVTTLALIVARAWGLGGSWSPAERAAHLLWLGWVVFFGVIDSGITINYLLAPVTLMLAAVALDVSAIVRRQEKESVRWRSLVRVGALVVVFALISSAWGVDPRARLAAARPTIVAPDMSVLRPAVDDASIVACTDELACLLLVGRVDRWLALDDFLRARFVVARKSGDVGVYAGSPAVYRLSELIDNADNRQHRTQVIVVDVFKDLPVGPSRAFLPRALATEGLRARPLIETPQLRVVTLENITRLAGRPNRSAPPGAPVLAQPAAPRGDTPATRQ